MTRHDDQFMDDVEKLAQYVRKQIGDEPTYAVILRGALERVEKALSFSTENFITSISGISGVGDRVISHDDEETIHGEEVPAGTYGVVTKINAKELSVNVEFHGYGLVMHVDPNSIEPAH